MAGNTVLITGGNGHVGFKVLVKLLEAGYTLRAAVRSSAKADAILAAPSVQALDLKSKLSFVIVPDLLAPGAYDEAVKDVDYIIHLASPILSGFTEDQFEIQLIQPAVKGTTGILYSALSILSIKRVVITSSIVAQMSFSDIFIEETGKVLNEASRISDPTGPVANEFEAYSNSKVRALNATEQFMTKEKPHFSVVHVHPSFVIGANELATTVDGDQHGTNKTALGQVLGFDMPFPVPNASVHLDDAAELHVKALDPNIPNGQSLVGNSGAREGTTWGDAIGIVKRHFPKAVKNGVLPNSGVTSTKKVAIDVSETEKLTGIKFKSYEEQVLSVVKQYLDLIGAEAA
ncbi:hypothetical protein LTR56_008366 [Elasticomyces elasticus]|nr:hypothetical protein LTR56_008366 [Elasticomyces elasticus]KAK3661502.1 hypothetical protein LTR22_007512 [Elasticomyces elasticus]KAK5756923.1 hypothetical protein LTS12_013002 [Elasticomyces elasticus]